MRLVVDHILLLMSRNFEVDRTGAPAISCQAFPSLIYEWHIGKIIVLFHL